MSGKSEFFFFFFLFGYCSLLVVSCRGADGCLKACRSCSQLKIKCARTMAEMREKGEKGRDVAKRMKRMEGKGKGRGKGKGKQRAREMENEEDGEDKERDRISWKERIEEQMEGMEGMIQGLQGLSRGVVENMMQGFDDMWWAIEQMDERRNGKVEEDKEVDRDGDEEVDKDGEGERKVVEDVEMQKEDGNKREEQMEDVA